MSDLVIKWEKAKLELDKAKQLELELRNQIVDSMFFEYKNDEVIVDNQVSETMNLKCKFSYYRNIDMANLETVKSEISNLNDIWEDYFTYVPKLNLKNYKNADKKIRLAIEKALVVKPTQPTLTLKYM